MNVRRRTATTPCPPGTSDALGHVLVCAALAEARKRSVRVAVAVVDAGGHLLASARMDTLPWQLGEIARDKAATAAGFGITTAALAFDLARHSKNVADFFRGRDGIVLLGGGVPLRVDGRLLGGIGISGGSEAEDEACALAAIAACLPAEDTR